MTASRFIDISANGTMLFLIMSELHSIEYKYHIVFIHFSVNAHLGCTQVLATANSAATNIGVHIILSNYVFPGYMPRSESSMPYGSLVFSSLRNLWTVLRVAITSLHFHQQHTRVLFSPHPPQCLLLDDFWWRSFWPLFCIFLPRLVYIPELSLIPRQVPDFHEQTRV